MSLVRAWASQGPQQALFPYEYEAGDLGSEEVEIEVESCGLCHSDLLMLHNALGFSTYPLVPGHEVIGRIVALGHHARGLSLGQRVGLGWNAETCMHCQACLSGHQNLCAQARPTIAGHYGGFAERVRAHWAWTIPLPEELDPTSAGPLLCAGVTVFSPFLLYDVKPTQRVGIVGIGGLGHLALKFAAAWGCEVTAFTSNAKKHADVRAFGAHRVVSSTNAGEIRALAHELDLLLVTTEAVLDWSAFLAALSPQGRLHFVGFVPEALSLAVSDLIIGQRSISGSVIGAPSTLAETLRFAARHRIQPEVEHFPMSQVNEALARLHSGNAPYRIVLDADFATHA